MRRAPSVATLGAAMVIYAEMVAHNVRRPDQHGCRRFGHSHDRLDSAFPPIAFIADGRLPTSGDRALKTRGGLSARLSPAEGTSWCIQRSSTNLLLGTLIGMTIESLVARLRGTRTVRRFNDTPADAIAWSSRPAHHRAFIDLLVLGIIGRSIC
jgi:hypothetical protein